MLKSNKHETFFTLFLQKPDLKNREFGSKSLFFCLTRCSFTHSVWVMWHCSVQTPIMLLKFYRNFAREEGGAVASIIARDF